MSKAPVRRGGEPRRLLSRILEAPELVSMVRSLEPRALGKLVNHVGLEDAGELVALATTDQLRQVFDEDLWQSERAGVDESFDADRFALWLEVMLEGGEAFVAEKLGELPEELVTLGLFRQILVVNLDELAVEMADGGDDAELAEKALDGCLYQEFDEYRVIARRHDGWDAVLAALLALDRHDHDLLQGILARSCHASSEFIEENGGLYDVLSSAEMLEADAAAEREDRRAREGYVAPSAAKGFLELARITPLPELVEARESDTYAKAYFRSLDRRGEAAPVAALAAPAGGASRLIEVLREAQVLEAELLEEEKPVALLPAGPDGEPVASGLFGRALASLQESDGAAFLRRTRELGFLANVLLSSCNAREQSLRSVEAVEAAVTVCNVGLEHLTADAPGRAAEVLGREGADKLFRIGWHLIQTGTRVPGEALARVRFLLGER